MNQGEVNELKQFACRIRMETMKCIASRGFGHVGGSLSIADVLAVLYGRQMRVDPQNPDWPERDFLVVSKGHAGPAVYATLMLKGYFPQEMLYTLNHPHSRLPSHCDMTLTPGIDMTTGSLGQGASTAMGIALGNRLSGYDNDTYLILGDGESQEGQTWEAALFANQHKLKHMIAFVDYNRLQIDGPTDEVCTLGDMAEKYAAFGWYTQSINGNDVEEIDRAIAHAKRFAQGPSMIVLNTIKGLGFSEAEGKLSCHSMNISAEQLEKALGELQSVMDKLRS